MPAQALQSAMRPFDIKIAYQLADGRPRRCVRKVMASTWTLAVNVALRNIEREVPSIAGSTIKSIKL